MMNYHILTLFPDMVMDGLKTSIIGRAINKGAISLEAINIRDYATNKHGTVDDYPYGGGAGMVMQAEPIYLAYEDLRSKIKERTGEEAQSPRVIYLSPQGKTFSQQMATELAKEEDLIFLCGHYEGVDERVLEMIEEVQKRNEQILAMYQAGSSPLDIAKKLDMGVGEVKLVVGLFQGEQDK